MNDRGIFITWDFWKDKSTTLSEKAILLEINNLSMLKLGCIAQNSHFADIMGIKKEAVSRLISSLEKKGYINTEIKNGSRNFHRTITINKMLMHPKQNVNAPLTNCLETKDNKTINKTINTSLEEIVSMWNRYASSNNKSKVLKLTGKRKEKLLKRIKELTDYKTAFNTTLVKASKSTFCKEGTWFSFDWLIDNDTNLVKVFEGKYDNKAEEW